MKLARRLLPLALLSLPAVAGAQQTWVVDAALGAGADFASIEAAVGAATAGDTVLVRSGTYGPFQVLGKGLTVTADSSANVLIQTGSGPYPDGTQVEQLPAGQTCVLRGLRFEATYIPPFSNGGTLFVYQCQGAVLVEDCRWNGADCAVRDSASATFVRCEGTGNDGGFTTTGGTWEASAGLRVQNAGAFAYESTFVGGVGADNGPKGAADPGGSGVLLTDAAFLYAAGCTFQGGQGGSEAPALYPCPGAGQGGLGLWLYVGAPSAVLRDTRLLGGAAGSSMPGCPAGTPGAPMYAFTGTVTTYPEPEPTLASSSPVREGQALDLTATSQPGDLGVLLVASQFPAQYLSTFASALAVPPTATALSIGFFPAGGTLVFQPLVPDLGPGVEGKLFALQIAACDLGAGQCWIGNPTAPIALDSSF